MGPNSESLFRPAGVNKMAATEAVVILQYLLSCELEMYLTIKQAHWNVIGPAFIGVHKLLDKGADLALEMSDGTAERIATLGAAPVGTPGAIVSHREHEDYPLLKAETQQHLTAIDHVLSDVGGKLRNAIARTGVLDVVSQNMLLGHAESLEKFQWLVRAHLEIDGGALPGSD